MSRTLVCTKMWAKVNGVEEEVDVEGYLTWTQDDYYGSDEDGNRSWSKRFVEKVEDVTAYLDSKQVELSKDDREGAEELLNERFFEEGA